ncbi:hypothetical protein CTI14_72320, partial [Methylobacterium radiotolerans]
TGWIYVHDRATGKLIGRSAPLLDQKNLFSPPTPQGTGWIYVHDRATGKLIGRSAPLLDQKNLFSPPTP